MFSEWFKMISKVNRPDSIVFLFPFFSFPQIYSFRFRNHKWVKLPVFLLSIIILFLLLFLLWLSFTISLFLVPSSFRTYSYLSRWFPEMWLFLSSFLLSNHKPQQFANLFTSCHIPFASPFIFQSFEILRLTNPLLIPSC